MAEPTKLHTDLVELLARIQADGYVSDTHDGTSDLLSTLHALPTLGERGCVEEVREIARTVLDARDEEGGWDDTWKTVIAVESLVGLKLRNLPVDGVVEALEYAVNVLRSAPPLEPMERELRLARALVLAGMARQESALLDAGILRIHALLDTTPQWSTDLTETLHGLLSLVDLLAISKDDATRALIEQQIQSTNLEDVDAWAVNAPVQLQTRAGIVLAKLERVEPARALLALANGADAATCDTITLKHRIELAARLETMGALKAQPLPEDDEAERVTESVSEDLFSDHANGSAQPEAVEPEPHAVVAGDTETDLFSDPGGSLLILESLVEVWKRFPATAPTDREQAMLEVEDHVYGVWADQSMPLVSLLLALDDTAEAARNVVSQVLDHTDTIPFELLICLPDTADPALYTLFDEVGAYTVKVAGELCTAENLARVIKEAKAPYIAPIKPSDTLQPGWLPEQMRAALTGQPSTVYRKDQFDPETYVTRVHSMDTTTSGIAPPPKTSTPDKSSMADLLAQADALIREGDYSSAESALVEMQPALNGHVAERVIFWTLLGDARFRQDRPDEAFQCYQKAVKDDASAERAWIGIGTYHMIKDELEQARSIFSRVVELNPSNQRGHLGLGNSFLKEEKPDEALQHFQHALNHNPSFRHAVVGLVAAAVQSEKMSEAVSGLSSYLEHCPQDVEARFHLAAIYFGTNQASLAKSEAETVLKVNPNHDGARQIVAHLAGPAPSGQG
ncbi:tetratricopeptide repeat protein [bacterium]|nr:tetratricopeptide repeat protein [bacterium]